MSRRWRFVKEQGAQLLLTVVSYVLFTAGGLAVYAYVWAAEETVSLYLHDSLATPAAATAGVALMLLGMGLGFWNYRRVRLRSKAKRIQRRRRTDHQERFEQS